MIKILGSLARYWWLKLQCASEAEPGEWRYHETSAERTPKVTPLIRFEFFVTF